LARKSRRYSKNNKIKSKGKAEAGQIETKTTKLLDICKRWVY
jgi:hypothetical protein